MSSLKGKVVFITGASSGIGKALAERAVFEGAKVVATARRKDRLEELSTRLGPQCLALSADVTQPESLVAAVKAAESQFGKIDVLIANAGFGVTGLFCKLTTEDYRRQMETNVFGVLNSIYACLETLKKSQGSIGIIGSVAGYTTLPGMSPYSMSKYSVRALAEALYYEMKYFGVSVTHIAPGFVESEIRKVDNQGEFKTKAPEPLPKFLVMRTDKAAKQILSAIRRRKAERVITNHGKLLVFVKKHFSGLMRTLIVLTGARGRSEPA